MANQLQTTCDNLWSVVAARRAGRGRRPASPAFVGCISGLGCRPRLLTRRQPLHRMRPSAQISVERASTGHFRLPLDICDVLP
jgi:hypothetical protein